MPLRYQRWPFGRVRTADGGSRGMRRRRDRTKTAGTMLRRAWDWLRRASKAWGCEPMVVILRLSMWNSSGSCRLSGEG